MQFHFIELFNNRIISYVLLLCSLLLIGLKVMTENTKRNMNSGYLNTQPMDYLNGRERGRHNHDSSNKQDRQCTYNETPRCLRLPFYSGKIAMSSVCVAKLLVSVYYIKLLSVA